MSNPYLVRPMDVTFLQMSRIAQHDPAKITRSVGAVDRTVKSASDERRDIAVVIDVGV